MHKGIVIFLTTLLVLSGSFGATTEVLAQEALQAGFLKFQLIDGHCASGAGTTRSTPAGSGSWSSYGSDSDDWDPDCVRFWLDSSIPQNLDIRICLQFRDVEGVWPFQSTVTGTERCTPWASDGGGWSSWATDSSDIWAIDFLRVRIYTRAMPDGGSITNMRVGYQSSMAPGNNCGNTSGWGAEKYTPYMADGGGWSGWAPEGANEGSIACGRINLDIAVDEGGSSEPEPEPSVSLSATPLTVGGGEMSTLEWDIQSVSECVLEGLTVAGGSLVESRSLNETAQVYTFTGNDSWIVPEDIYVVDALVVGGGGGGGTGRGGGGGGGGVSMDAFIVDPGDEFAIVVGAGGSGATTANSTGGNGGQSSLIGSGESVTALGGGGGGSHNTGSSSIRNGKTGGSGGGASINYLSTRPTGGSGTSGQGNAGGSSQGAVDTPRNTGGGGGAGSAGITGSGTNTKPNGGSGIESDISGSSVYYGGGGGGAYGGFDRPSACAGIGGTGGGGNGYSRSAQGCAAQTATEGAANTGGGGGGGGEIEYSTGKNGGSGVVIVRTFGSSHTTVPLTESTEYTLTCEGDNGENVSDSVTITVEADPEITLFEVRVNGGTPSTQNQSITPDDELEFQWDTENAVSCTSTFLSPVATSSSWVEVDKPYSGATDPFTLQCNGISGTTPVSATIEVSVASALPTLTVDDPDKLVRRGDTVEFTWDLNGNDPAECSFKGPGMPTVDEAISPSFERAVQGNAKYSLTCEGGTAEVEIQVLPNIFET